VLRTRIDDYDTPLEMARKAGLRDIAAILERKGQPIRQRLHGDAVRWPTAWGPLGAASLEDDGATLLTEVLGTGRQYGPSASA
jgi:hypothetical protein